MKADVLDIDILSKTHAHEIINNLETVRSIFGLE